MLGGSMLGGSMLGGELAFCYAGGPSPGCPLECFRRRAELAARIGLLGAPLPGRR
jgi:hypothetical protein